METYIGDYGVLRTDTPNYRLKFVLVSDDKFHVFENEKFIGVLPIDYDEKLDEKEDSFFDDVYYVTINGRFVYLKDIFYIYPFRYEIDNLLNGKENWEKVFRYVDGQLKNIEFEDFDKVINKNSYMFTEERQPMKSCHLFCIYRDCKQLEGFANIDVELGIRLIREYDFKNTHNHYFQFIEDEYAYVMQFFDHKSSLIVGDTRETKFQV